MIQRPPACERHAAELPGKAHIVPSDECPWCWAEARERAAAPPPEPPEHLRDPEDLHRVLRKIARANRFGPYSHEWPEASR